MPVRPRKSSRDAKIVFDSVIRTLTNTTFDKALKAEGAGCVIWKMGSFQMTWTSLRPGGLAGCKLLVSKKEKNSMSLLLVAKIHQGAESV